MRNFLFTSESVSEGHPDKLADQISDAVVDAYLARDSEAHVACETLCTTQRVVIAGEFKSNVDLVPELDRITRQVIREVGYTDPTTKFDDKNCTIQTYCHAQSGDIDMGVTQKDGQIGAGDQGLMFGYAVRETPELMPLPIMLAHKLLLKQSQVRKSGQINWLRPDAKSQVSVRYEGQRPIAVEKIVLSTQHAGGIDQKLIRAEVIDKIINPIIPKELVITEPEILVNPTGCFETGGPAGDTGLTGRKIIVDTYGGSCPHGGGAFSGKDPTKVDRSAAYMARYIAKNIVAAELAQRCTVQLAYAIGVVDPVSVMIDLHGTGLVDEVRLAEAVRAIFKLTPRGIIESLDLRRPIYRKTAAYGHFGRELPEFSWEKTDKVADIRSFFNVKNTAQKHGTEKPLSV